MLQKKKKSLFYGFFGTLACVCSCEKVVIYHRSLVMKVLRPFRNLYSQTYCYIHLVKSSYSVMLEAS